MAVDDWLLATAVGRPPVLRLYGWLYPTISLGRHEAWRRVVDPARLRRRGVRLVRRPTGGRAVWHHRELTYSVTAGRGMLKEFEVLEPTLQRLSQALVRGLERLGVEARFRRRTERAGRPSRLCFEAATRYELVSGGRKVVGSAQYRTPEAFLQHGSIPAFDTIPDLRAVRPGCGHPGGRPHGGGPPAPWAVLSAADVAQAVAEGFCREFGWTREPMVLHEADRAAIRAVLAARYGRPEWTFRC